MDLTRLTEIVQAVGGASEEAIAATRTHLLVDLAKEWLSDQTLLLREGTRYQYRLSVGVLERHGISTPADVTAARVRAFMRMRIAAGCSTETANRNLAALSSLVGWLHAAGRSPLAQVLELRELYFPRRTPPPPAFLTPERYRVIRRASRGVELTGRLDLLVAFGVEAGLRYHEARQLHLEDLTLLTDEPYITVALTHGRRNKKDAARTVPISLEFAEELLRLRLREGPIFPARIREGEQAPKSPYLHKQTFRDWRLATFEVAGKWDWHLLRHTFASWHVQAGRSIAMVALWMGNSVAVCQRHYASLAPGGHPDVARGFPLIRRASS